MSMETSPETGLFDGMTIPAARAVEIVRRQLRSTYGNDLLKVVLFGSRGRGDARPDSDVDVAVVLKAIQDRRVERDRLSDIAYNAIVETSVDVQAVPISASEWNDPEIRRNPALVKAIKHEGIIIEGRNRQKISKQGGRLREGHVRS